MSYIFTNSRLITCETPGELLDASLLVETGRIAEIGSLEDCRRASKEPCEVIDLKGNVLLPAFTDTHTHFTELARQLVQIDLSGCVTIGEIRSRLEDYRKNNPLQPRWILGGGWDKNSLDQPQQLDRRLLDEFFPDVPVALQSKDYHSRWCNSAALRETGLDTQKTDPAGGKIFRDATGLPTGILVETASDMLETYIVPLSEEQTLKCLSQTVSGIHRMGLTTVHSMEAAPGAEILERFVRESRQLRVVRNFYPEQLAALEAGGKRSGDGDAWYRLGGLKLFADGALGSQTGAIFAAYSDSPQNMGILRLDAEEMHRLVLDAAQKGFYSVIHAIGDRAVSAVIDAFLRLRESDPGPSLLHRVEHVQAIAARDIPRLKQTGVRCAMQPVHLANDVDMIEAYWPSLREEAYCFRSLLDAGITLGLGSDAPIETIDPCKGIYSAIERKNKLDPRAESWLPGECISVWEAIQAYTLGAAKLSGSQGWSGSLAKGKIADLIVLRDFTTLSTEYWLEAASLLTMLAGQPVYREDF